MVNSNSLPGVASSEEEGRGISDTQPGRLLTINPGAGLITRCQRGSEIANPAGMLHHHGGRLRRLRGGLNPLGIPLLPQTSEACLCGQAGP